MIENYVNKLEKQSKFNSLQRKEWISQRMHICYDSS